MAATGRAAAKKATGATKAKAPASTRVTAAAPPTPKAATTETGAVARTAAAAISADERRGRIEMLAYLFAEERGFAPGRDLDDWLAAEVEVDRELSVAG
jgi:hypothetical protein